MDWEEDLKKRLDNYRGVIFDMDGTLVDLDVDWETLREALQRLVFEKTGVEMVFRPLDQKTHEVKTRFGKDLFSEVVDLTADYEVARGTPPIKEAMVRCYQRLPDKKIALYTMNTVRCAEHVIANCLKRKPDIVIAKDTCEEPKPTDKDVKKILAIWKLAPSEVLYVGDSERDRVSGEMAGVSTYIIDNQKI